MLSQLQPKTANQDVPSISPIDTKPIVEHGESPTAIILAIAILITMLVSSITGLIQIVSSSKTSK